MYPIHDNGFRVYDQDRVTLNMNGHFIQLENKPGKQVSTTIHQTISHDGKLVEVANYHYQTEPDGPALTVITDGVKVTRLLVNVLQGSEAEDKLGWAAVQAGRPEWQPLLFRLSDANDEKGDGNSWVFYGVVRFPRFIDFGSECGVRTFEIEADEDAMEDGEDEVDDWSTRAFGRDLKEIPNGATVH